MICSCCLWYLTEFQQCAPAFSHLLFLCRHRGGTFFSAALRIASGYAGLFFAGEPEGRHAREHVVPKDQRMHQCGAQMGQEGREEEKRKYRVHCAKYGEELWVLRRDRWQLQRAIKY